MTNPLVLLSSSGSDVSDQLLTVSSDSRFEFLHCAPGQSWITAAEDKQPDIVLAQGDEFSEDDLNLLVEKDLASSTEIILFSEGSPNPFLDQAMRAGVSYHLRHPIDEDYLNEILAELLEEISSNSAGSQEALTSNLDQFGLLLGSSRPIRKLCRVVRKAAASNASILIIGESGVGKELVANTLHLSSDRRDNAFITVNCGAISPELIESELFGHIKGAFTGATDNRTGVFEQAEGGTLFLDEITEMPIDQQVKLLRVLESGEFRKVGSETTQYGDVRVVAATNREPAEAVADEKLREDLYFRLAQFPIRVPPLRERGDDIVGLARHFLAQRNAEENTTVELSEDSIKRIGSHTWPGNVRELKHTIERAYILAEDTIGPNELIIEDPALSTEESVPTGVPLDEIEKQVILKTLEENGGNKKETAERLGISVKTLYNKLEKYEAEE